MNIQDRLNTELADAGVSIQFGVDGATLFGPHGHTRLHVVRLYRPSAAEVVREAAPTSLLLLDRASRKALDAAANTNHVILPDGGWRIVVPGVAAIHREATLSSVLEQREVRLRRRTGVLAETLLLGGMHRAWTVKDLAMGAHVSPALAHRFLQRMERESLVSVEGSGPNKMRLLGRNRELAELWAAEEAAPDSVQRAYLYAESNDGLLAKLVDLVPEGAFGGVAAANRICSVLTQVSAPVRFWVPEGASLAALQERGIEFTDSGANVEFARAAGDPWSVHALRAGVPTISPWRAWREIAFLPGRVQELADALLETLL